MDLGAEAVKSLLEQADESPVTFVVVLAYVTLAFLTDPFSPKGEMLLEYGALQPVLVVEGEPWRLLAHAFLHGGIVHLGFNTLALVWFGPVLERSLGSIKFSLLYVVSALGGALAVCLVQDPRMLVVGGSGALFGMMGAAVAMNMRAGRHLLSFLQFHGPRQLIGLIVFNLVLGMLIPVISNTAHVGGLLAGFVLVFCFLDRGRTRPDGVSRAIHLGWAALFVGLLFHACLPATRWDFLADRFNEASSAGERQRAAAIRQAIEKIPGVSGILTFETRSRDGGNVKPK